MCGPRVHAAADLGSSRITEIFSSAKKKKKKKKCIQKIEAKNSHTLNAFREPICPLSRREKGQILTISCVDVRVMKGLIQLKEKPNRPKTSMEKKTKESLLSMFISTPVDDHEPRNTTGAAHPFFFVYAPRMTFQQTDNYRRRRCTLSKSWTCHGSPAG